MANGVAESGKWECVEGWIPKNYLPPSICAVRFIVEDMADLYRGVVEIICSDLVVLRKLFMSSAKNLRTQIWYLIHRADTFPVLLLPPGVGNWFVQVCGCIAVIYVHHIFA